MVEFILPRINLKLSEILESRCYHSSNFCRPLSICLRAQLVSRLVSSTLHNTISIRWQGDSELTVGSSLQGKLIPNGYSRVSLIPKFWDRIIRYVKLLELSLINTSMVLSTGGSYGTGDLPLNSRSLNGNQWR